MLGGLDDSEGRVFRAHLLECGSCRARVGELRAIAHDLADVERDERRVRAAQAIETKRRESDDEADEPLDPPPSPRVSRMTVIVGLVLIIGLSLWNFTLRGNNAELSERLSDEQLASQVVNFGTPWTSRVFEDGVEGVVREGHGRLAVFLQGVEDDDEYAIYLLATAGRIRGFEVEPAVDGMVRVLVERPEEVIEVQVTRPSGRPSNTSVCGTRVLSASGPEVTQESSN